MVCKIISKVLSQRLTFVLPPIIDIHHGAFLKHMGITSTGLATLKLIHQVVHSSKTANHLINIVIKLDLSKAFDCIERHFIITIL